MAIAIKDSKIQEVKDSDWEYSLDSTSALHGSHTAVVPMSSNAQSARLFYAARFVNQAMPLHNRETPLVQSLDPGSADGKSYEQQYGQRMGARYFDDDEGEVVDLTPDEVVVKLKDGTKKSIDLYNNFQFNRKTYIHNTPRVQIGDKLKKGQIVASSNYTDNDGTLSMGANARVAMVPYKGFSMDDAIVISEDFAKRMTSEHNYQHEQQKDDDTKFGKDHYTSLFPTKFTKEQMDNLDDNGMAKPGTILHKGDPIMLATRPKPVYSNAAHLGKLGKVFRSIRGDAAEVWDHDYPGTVTDIVDGKKTRKVFVSALAPMEVGDKMVIRNGQKCYHPDTEVLTENGWKRIGAITMDDKVASLFDRNAEKTAKDFGVARAEAVPQDFVARFVSPVAITAHEFDGELYCLETTSVAYAVTGNHRVWCRCPNGKRFRATDASAMHGCCRVFMDTAPYDLESRTAPELFEIPYVDFEKAGRPSELACNTATFNTRAFVKFLAFYLREGNYRPGVDYSIILTQKERPFCRDIEALLDELNMPWQRYGNQYRISPNKSLSLYLRQFGHAADKFIPEWVFGLPKEYLQDFIDWAWQGDGGKQTGNMFYSSSFKLIEGIQRILIMLGYRTRWTKRAKRPHQNHDAYVLTRFKSASYTLSDVGNAFRGRDKQQGYYRMPYTGLVHCCQVPGCGVILTRYHGKIMWNGNSIVSKILPGHEMLQGKDGKPFDVLLNPLALPSRVNTSTLYELAYGKIAEKAGKPIAVPNYTKPGESRLDHALNALKKAGLEPTEEVFDPTLNRKLEHPVTTGTAYVYKLHHVVASKKSARGNSAYSQDEQPLKGGSDSAQAKRLGGLETTAMMAKGGYAVLRDGATIRGQKNDDYWRAVRQGYRPAEPGVPFVFGKFKALLNGAGMNPKDLGKGRLRLSPLTDKDLDSRDPLEVANGKMVKPDTLESEEGGLFDKRLVALNKWGKITLPTALPNPAMEGQIALLLGIKVADLRKVLAGEVDLEDVQKRK